MPKRSDKDARIRRAAKRAMEMMGAEFDRILCRDYVHCTACRGVDLRRRKIIRALKAILREVGE